MRALLPVGLILALAACAGAPKKPAPPAATIEDGKHSQAASGKKRSPYAPAQEDPSKRGDYVAGGLYAPHVRDSVPDDIPDFDAIPEPEIVDEPRSRVGNRSSYSVLGKRYHVMASAKGYAETGVASFYGKKFHGRRTSNLEVYDMYAFTAAHKTLPLPSFARVTNLENGKSVIVRVNDRGPFHDGRIIDLSYAAAAKLGYLRQGTARVEVRALTPGDEPPLLAQQKPAPPPETPQEVAPVNTAMDTLVAAIPQVMPAAGAGAIAQSATDHRFDMRQDGRTMTADEFDAWMKSRRIHVATGAPAAMQPAAQDTHLAPHTTPGERVVLQVASFTTRANADRALAMLRGAGIGDATLSDADANGRKVWRLRVGPLAATVATELAQRIAGLGFGLPQRVRD